MLNYFMDENKMRKSILVLLGIIVFVVVMALVYFLKSIFIPLSIAMILSFVAQPFLKLFKKLRIPSSLGIITYLMMLLVLIFVVVLFFGSSINSFIDKSDEYRESYSQLYDKYSDPIKEFFNIPKEDPFNINDLINEVFPEKLTDQTNIEDFNINERRGNDGFLFSRFDWFSLLKPLLSFSGSFVSFMGKLLLVMIFLMFILAESTSINGKLLNIFPGKQGSKLRNIFANVNEQVVKYLNVKVLISLITGVLVYFSSFFIGLDFPFMWGVIAFVMNFIPSIGSILFFFMPTAMAIVQFLPDERWGSIVAVIISIGSIEFVVGSLIDPKLSGDKLDLSALVIIVSLLFWGWMWGIAGMFLAVPIMLVGKIVCENVPILQPIAVLLSSGNRFSPRRKRGIYRLFVWINYKIKYKTNIMKKSERKGLKISKKSERKGLKIPKKSQKDN